MKRLTLSRVMLVRESCHNYHIPEHIDNPTDVVMAVNDVFHLDDAAEEHFLTVLLDTKNHIAGMQEISIGTVSGSLVHPREVFRSAILHNASGIILVHNHPSGDPTPSKEDLLVTARLVECGKMMDMQILDHVIIGNPNYTSLREEGFIKDKD